MYAWFNFPDFNSVYSCHFYLAGLSQQQKLQGFPLVESGQPYFPQNPFQKAPQKEKTLNSNWFSRCSKSTPANYQPIVLLANQLIDPCYFFLYRFSFTRNGWNFYITQVKETHQYIIVAQTKQWFCFFNKSDAAGAPVPANILIR